MKILSASIIIFIVLTRICFSQEETKIFGADQIISLAKDINPKIFYAASKNAVYQSKDKGNSWKKIYHISKANKDINKVYVEPSLTEVVYIATKSGLYQSQGKFSNWQRIFRGSSDLENNCLCLGISSKALYLGTEAGLFISYDRGKNWHKSVENFSESIISAITINPVNQDIVYIASQRGVFISQDNGKNFKRVYVVYGSEDSPEDDSDDEDDNDSEQTFTIKAMAISQGLDSRIYIATTNGIFYSDDQGKNWQKITNFGLSSLDIRAIIFDANNKIVAATDKGIFRLEEKFWEQINGVLGYKEVNDLTVDDEAIIWIAAKDGIYKFKEKNENGRDLALQPISQKELHDLFKGEPTIREVQSAAVEYANVNMNKIKSWTRQARLKALLPTFNLDYDKNVYGSSSGAMAVGPRDWALGFSWDVADLIWSGDIKDIDYRSEQTVELRQDILDQTTRLYYERQKLKAELFLSSPEDPKERLYKELQIQELTANLDGLTNGLFSKSIQQKE